MSDETGAAPVLAFHFHDEIVRQFLISPLVILVGVPMVAVALRRSRATVRGALVGVGLCVAAVGLFGLAEVQGLRHNHLCHGHHSDASTCVFGHDSAGHTHRFGGRAARPRRWPAG